MCAAASMSAKDARRLPAMAALALGAACLAAALMTGGFGRRSTALLVATLLALLFAWANARSILAAFPVNRKRSLLLGGAAGAAGFLLAFPAVWIISAATPRLWVTASAAGAAIATGAIAGFTAVLRTRTAAAAGSLLVLQVAAASLLGFAAALLLRSATEVERMDRGYRPDGLLTVHVPPGRVPLLPDALDRIAQLPGVEAAGAADAIPETDPDPVTQLELDDRPVARDHHLAVRIRTVTPGYFAAMGMRVLSGRGFTGGDPPNAAVAIVNQVIAERYWPGESPLGKRIHAGGARTVVGVVSNANHTGWVSTPQLHVYVPHSHDPAAAAYLLVRAADPGRLAPTIRDAVRDIDPERQVEIRTMREILDDRMSAGRRLMLAAGMLAALAIALAATAAYGFALHSPRAGTRIAAGIGVALLLAIPVRLFLGAAVLLHVSSSNLVLFAAAAVAAAAPAAAAARLGRRLARGDA
jgi:hypothetical protein